MIMTRVHMNRQSNACPLLTRAIVRAQDFILSILAFSCHVKRVRSEFVFFIRTIGISENADYDYLLVAQI